MEDNNVKNCPLSVEIRGKKHCLKAFGIRECVNCINQKHFKNNKNDS